MLYGLILKPIAILALIVGTITLPTPLPTGVPLIVFGLAVLVTTSSTARGRLKALRRRFGYFDSLIRRAEPMLARPLRVPLMRTRPIVPRAIPRGDRPGG
jgi:Putative transmembrane protein (PGPGW)